MGMTAAEKAAYSRGYAAGRKRTELETSAAIDASNRQWDLLKSKRVEISIAMMAALIPTTGWKLRGQPVTNMSDRAELARIATDELIRKMGIK